jgi:hypothetical protein
LSLAISSLYVAESIDILASPQAVFYKKFNIQKIKIKMFLLEIWFYSYRLFWSSELKLVLFHSVSNKWFDPLYQTIFNGINTCISTYVHTAKFVTAQAVSYYKIKD